MTRLHELYDRFGQSVWLDNLERRGLIERREDETDCSECGERDTPWAFRHEQRHTYPNREPHRRRWMNGECECHKS